MNLNQTLTQIFSAPAKRRAPDPDYAAFRAECKRQGLTYKIDRDGYIALSNARVFGHYTWCDSLYSLLHPEFDPE